MQFFGRESEIALLRRNRGLMELERFERMLEIAERDFNVFGGYALERYFYWKFVEDSSYTAMGSWWNRKGENEIDLVCFDEAAGRLDFYEVKHNPERIKIGVLERKVEAFLASNPKLRDKTIRCLPLSLNDM